MKMLKHMLLALGILQIAMGIANAKEYDVKKIQNPGFPDWFVEDEFKDLSELVAKAKANGKKGILLVFSTEGCSYCHLFNDQSLHDPDIAARVQKAFDAIGMEIFDDSEMVSPNGEALSVKQFAKREGVQFSPTILFYDTEGNRVFRKTGYQSPERFTKILDYVGNGHYATQSLRSYLESGKPAVAMNRQQALLENPVFMQPPYDLDRSRFSSNRPMLVIFEKRGCPDCVDFHRQVLDDNNVNSSLQRFDVVRLDANDDTTPVLTPGGERMTPSMWYQKQDFSRVPALMFIDPSGMIALQTDAVVESQRMLNSLNFMLERAYEKGWTYQRFARIKAIEKIQAKNKGSL